MIDRKKAFGIVVKTMIGCSFFGIGFNLFLLPNNLNVGGITGLSMVLVHLMNFSTIGTVSAFINLPLFILAGVKVGKKYFFSSLLGMLFSSIAVDVFSVLPVPATEPLIGGLYGGVMCGVGLGIILTSGGSTGGSDIIVRLLKLRWRDVPIGTINILFDATVAILTGIVFKNVTGALYSGVAIFVSGQVVDAVVYRFDYSKVVLVISKHHEAIAAGISQKLERGVTYLDGQGYYSHTDTKVILTAIKRQQLAELKDFVTLIDPEAFVIVQEAHQVLGDGFSRHSKDTL